MCSTLNISFDLSRHKTFRFYQEGRLSLKQTKPEKKKEDEVKRKSHLKLQTGNS